MKTATARRAAAATVALALAAGSLAAGTSAASAAPERSAKTSVHTGYLQDTLGVPTETVIETATYNRLFWLLKQPGQFAVLVGSTTDAGFAAKAQQVDLAAKAQGISKVYWFDPNLSGYSGRKNLDTRNPSGIELAPAARTIYGHTWRALLAEYIGNGVKANGVGSGTVTTVDDDDVVNDAVAPLWDYRDEPAAAPVGDSSAVFFVYDKDRQSGGQADKIAGGFDVSAADANGITAGVAAAASAVGGGANVDQIGQFEWWRSENNARLATQNDPVRYGETVLDPEDNVGGWNVQQLTYPELLHLLDDKTAGASYALLLGGTWCPNTRAVIKDVNREAKANDVITYNFDTVLDGGIIGGGTTAANNPLQVRNNVALTSGGVTTPDYVPSYLFGDLVRKYLRNIITEYDPNTGTRVMYYPDGDLTATPDVVRRLQVPFLVNYERGTGGSPSTSSIKRQWIQQSTNPTTGLPAFKEYMSQFWFTSPTVPRIGLSTTQLPLGLDVPDNPLDAPDTAFLTAEEQALPQSEWPALVNPRRSAVSSAVANREFGREAVRELRRFFGGLPGAVTSTQTVTAPSVAYGTAPKVNLAIDNEYGRVPAGDATLQVAGKTYVTQVAQNGASFTLPKLAPGSYPFSVSYATDEQILGFEKTGTLTVTKAKVSSVSGTVVKAPTTKKAGKYKVSVTTPGGLAAASGKATVTLTKGGAKKSVSGTVKGGAVTVKVPKLAKGTWKVTVAYGGDASYQAASADGKAVKSKKAKVKKAKAKAAKKAKKAKAKAAKKG